MINKNNSINISKKKIAESGGVIVLPIHEYEDLKRRAVPEYYLTGKKTEEADKLVREGLKEYNEGKTISASSLEKALAIYGGKRKKKN